VELETGNKIQFIRADNWRFEFGPSFQHELCSAWNSVEPCLPYKHSMNDVVERTIQTVNKLARSMTYEVMLPIEI
jgi:hypothetical protein